MLLDGRGFENFMVPVGAAFIGLRYLVIIGAGRIGIVIGRVGGHGAGGETTGIGNPTHGAAHQEIGHHGRSAETIYIIAHGFLIGGVKGIVVLAGLEK